MDNTLQKFCIKVLRMFSIPKTFGWIYTWDTQKLPLYVLDYYEQDYVEFYSTWIVLKI